MFRQLLARIEQRSLHDRSRHQARCRRGVVSLLSALLLVFLLGIIALSVDVGYLMVVRTELQRSADAAALSAAEELADVNDRAADPTLGHLSAKAWQTARRYADLNPGGGKSLKLPENATNDPTGDFVVGFFDSSTGVFKTTGPRYNTVTVRLRRDSTVNGSVSLFFARIFGISEGNLSAEAAASRAMDVRGFRKTSDQQKSKLLPFAVRDSAWESRAVSGPDSFRHDRKNQSVSTLPDGIREMSMFPQGIGSGNYGTIDIGTASNGTNELRRQILDGPNTADFSHYPNNAFALGDDGTLAVGGDTGMSSAIKDDLLAIIGEPRVVPIYNSATGNGNNAEYTVVGFAGVTVVGVKLTGPLRNRYVTIQPSNVVDKTIVSGGQDGETSTNISGPTVLVRFPGS